MPMEHEPTRQARELPLHYWLLFQALFGAWGTWLGFRYFGVAIGLAGGAFLLGALVAAFFYDRRRRQRRATSGR